MTELIDPARIEKYVRNRRRKRAHALISLWLKENSDLESRIQASEWYRRLGDFIHAYRAIAPDECRLSPVTKNGTEARRLLWCAHILNHLGSSGYALEIARSIGTMTSADELRILGNLYLNEFDSKTALSYFEKADKTERNPKSYSARLGRVATCDALFGSGKRAEALKRLRRIPSTDEEVLLKGILLQVEGEYLARKGNYKGALVVLKKAKPYFSSDDISLDYAFYLKWLGIAQLGSCKTAGQLTLRKALKILTQPTRNPETWLDVFYWLDRLGLADLKQKQAIISYPGLPPGFLSRLKVPEALTVGNPKSAQIWISLPRAEWAWQENYSLSVPKEIQLLALIRRAYPYSIPVHRCFSLLWPNEVGNFLFLEARLNQLVNRLRDKYQIEVRIEAKALSLSAESSRKIAVEIYSINRAPSLFMRTPTVSLSDFREYYQLGRTQTHAMIKEKISEKSLAQVKRGRKTFLSLSSTRRARK